MAVTHESRTEIGAPAPVVDTACPLDCPDACTLHVTVHRGRIVEIDGSQKNPVTGGYICNKVRKFGERVYGPDRLLYPAIRVGPKGQGHFKRVPWDEALELVVDGSVGPRPTMAANPSRRTVRWIERLVD
jgi:anaerobic selenocysteine-containing dehydrogenase